MAKNTQLDSYEFPSLALPYDRSTRDLDSRPRIVAGQNMMITPGGKLIKRPGTTIVLNTTFTRRIDRLVVYETLENPAKIYLLASAFDTGTSTWGMWYNRLDGPAPGWTTCGTLRDCNASTRPHEIVISRGLAFIKGFPASGSAEKLGTVIFDGTGSPGPAGLTFWGLLGPTQPARMGGVVGTLNATVTAGATSWVTPTDPGWPATPFNVSCGNETATVTAKSGAGPVTLTVARGTGGTTAAPHSAGAEVVYKNWIASSQPIRVNVGWQYVYSYKTKTGHYSCRSPLETNPDFAPSNTGGFLNLIPKFRVKGHTDTTNVPTIALYRTTDGGGTFLKLGEITNTGAASITVSDNFLTSLGGQLDPLPDLQLDSNNVAPSLTANNPPPTVILPKVLGTDTPDPSTKMSYYAGRIWYAIGNVLLFSGQEEITAGVPEESFPTGINGNFFRFQHPIVAVSATSEALYVHTLKETYWVRGDSRATFVVKKIFGEIGAAAHPRAAIDIGNTEAWVTHDYRVASANATDVRLLTQPLYDDIVAHIGTGRTFSLHYFAELDKEFLVVNLIDQITPANCLQWVYDISQSTGGTQIWNTPWTIANSAMVSDRIRESDPRRYLAVYHWTGTTGQLAIWDSRETVMTDAMPSGAANYGHTATFSLIPNPAGNHVNLLRRPALNTVVNQIRLDRTQFVGDTDPVVEYYLDDIFTSPLVPAAVIEPPRRPQSKGYRTLCYSVNDACERVGLTISKPASAEQFELQGLVVTFNPDGGA
jgi:hypothetical protein